MRKIYETAVIFGGVSSENEVSVITGALACNVLKRGGTSVLPVYIDHSGVMRAGEELADVTAYKNGATPGGAECCFARGGLVLFGKKGKPKQFIEVCCVLNCCHGGAGEGGAVAGAAELCGLPFASAGLFASAAFMDKYYTKLVLKSLGVKTAKYAYSRDITGAIKGAKAVGYPVIVKPATLGSSIGIAKAENEEELKEALETAFEFDSGVLIEEYLAPRREINCAAYFADGKVITSPCEEFSSSGDLLSYDDKYSGGGTRVFPAQIEEKLAEKIRGETEKVYSAFGMRGIVRFDYIVAEGSVYLSEINTVPGSLSHYLLTENYAEFYRLLEKLMAQARADFKAKSQKKLITTGILNNLTANTCKLK